MVRGILFDLAGVVHVGDELCPGAAEALNRVRKAGLAVRFVTNTTRKTRRRRNSRMNPPRPTMSSILVFLYA